MGHKKQGCDLGAGPREAGKGHQDAATSLCECPFPAPQAWQHCPPAQAEIPHHQKKHGHSHGRVSLPCGFEGDF